MFLEVLKFELGYHRRQYLFYVLSGVFFLLAFLATTTPNVQLVGGIGNVNINSPFAVISTLASLSLLCLIGGIAFVAGGVIRDRELRVDELFLATPVTKRDYLYGRFAGGFIYAIGLFFAATLGVLLGEFMPWLDQERIGPLRLDAYWFGTWAIALPNLLVCCSLFFFLATITRSMMWTYVGMMGLLMLTLVLGTFDEKDTVELTSILDPFGATAFGELTRYWTVFEKNEQLPVLAGALLANRLLWLAIAVGFLAAAYPMYRFSVEQGGSGKRKSEDDFEPTTVSHLDLPAANQRFDRGAAITQYASQVRVEVKNIVFSAPFIVLLLLGVLNVSGNALLGLGNIFGTSVLPTTAILINMINGAYSLSLLAVVIYYSGELMVRERNVHVAEIMDALPWSNWVMIAAKLTGLLVVIVSMMLVAMLTGMAIQVSKGFFDIDVLQYLVGLLWFFQFPLYLMMVMGVFFFVLTRNKYIAMFLLIVYFILSLALPQMGFEHYLYRLSMVGMPYSDFTGYSQNLVAHSWQTLYWSLFGGLMLIVVHLLWPRGGEDDWKNRIRVMRGRMTQPVVLSTWVLATLFTLTGGYIYYNSVVLNDYVTNIEREELSAEYEKAYKQFETLKQPEVIDVYVEVDIYPGKREVKVSGRYVLENREDEAVEVVHVVNYPGLSVNEISIEGGELESEAERFGYRVYRLGIPMAPGETREMTFSIDWLTPGFANSGHSRELTRNGTFFNNTDIFPVIGYRGDFELQDNNTRREYDLPPVERMNPIDDASEYRRTGFNATTRVGFETIVSTSEDQIALAPGYLQEERVEDGRRYFHYKMDEPIWNFFSFMSADYEVARDTWNDVVIEVYYHHRYNVDRMIESVKDSFDYFTQNFSPYQYRQFRILEFPRFQGVFAQSFPNTIPFSEAIGFTADLSDPKDIDYVFYVTAHEVAHQWWAHQVLGANVQGQTMIVESLAQYSALMVMEEKYGQAHMKRFLEFELDSYLQGRGGEQIGEMPLYLVENQPYIHYRKGSVVLYALKDYIGEDRINLALSRFIDKYAFKGAPFPTTLDLIAEIRAVAGPEHDELITDLVERIILFDLRVVASNVTERDDGRFEVEIDVLAKKYEADGEGVETEVPMATLIDIGVLGEKSAVTDIPEIIYLEKFEVTGGEQQFTVVVDERPVSVGIDPLNKLIDRDPSDNVKAI